MIASVDLMAIQTIFLNGGMLEGIGAPLFGMAFITEVIDGVGFHHFRAKSSMDLMTAGAFNFPFIDRVMRLFILLGPNIFVASITEVRLFHLLGLTGHGVNGMALIAGDPRRSVSTHVP
ncbi:MAG: hypothetical protein N2509_01055 [Treponemataceae bacterium]|nr:hypothetical protein [Treponemataceae bacterium]